MTESISTGLDQPIYIPSSEQYVFHQVNEAIAASKERGTPHYALALLRELRGAVQARGLAAAKLLARLEDIWDELNVEDDFFNVVQTETGFAPATVRKYISMWRLVFENPSIPEEAKASLVAMPIRRLLKIVAAAREGLLEDKWDRVINVQSDGELRQLIREVRGKATSSQTAIIITLRRDGSLLARQGDNGLATHVGFLKIDTDDAVAQKAIARIIQAAGIVEL
jgi:hypothetical protein